MNVNLLHGFSEEVLKQYTDNYFDSVVTDPPYGLGKEPNANEMLSAWLDHGYLEVKGSGFMGKKWDAFVPQPLFWKEVYRVLKPGGHVLAFYGTRTYDWGVMAMRLAGFEVRDCIQWIYGSGFPKSMDISKAIDKEAGAEREVIGVSPNWRESKRNREINGSMEVRGKNAGLLHGSAATEQAKQWDGWGTALKPANEPIVLARKPLEKGLTVAGNVQKWGVGGLNIDGCRVGETGARFNGRNVDSAIYGKYGTAKPKEDYNKGRFPANVIMDEEAGAILNQQAPNTGAAAPVKRGNKGESNGIYGDFAQKGDDGESFRGDTGGASRFFYCAKTSPSERNAGMMNDRNDWPTVKPISLMRYLVRMVTPPGGHVLDPCMGSGSTGCACASEGFDFTGIDAEARAVEIAAQRINYHKSFECTMDVSTQVDIAEKPEKKELTPTQQTLF